MTFVYSHPTPDHDIGVVGSGVAGLGMAIGRQQQGRTDMVVLEQRDSVGGTWRERTADRFGIRPTIRLNSRMTAAGSDEAAQFWRLSINDGADTLTSRVLIGGPGPRSRPSYPKVPGREDFAGTQFDLTHWDHDHSSYHQDEHGVTARSGRGTCTRSARPSASST